MFLLKRSACIIISTLLTVSAAAQVNHRPGVQPAGVQPAQAEPSELSDPHPRRFFRKFATEEYRIWTSPFRPSSYDSHTVKEYLIPFAIIGGTLIATDKRTDVWSDSLAQKKWSRRVSQIGAGYTLAGFSGATFLFGHVTKNHHARETGLLALEAAAHAQIVTFSMKQITNRARPLDGDQKGGFWKGGNSFPSGHAMSSFAIAAVFAYEYRYHIAVPITAYGLATVVSVSRLSAREHWLSDIFVGGSTGFLLGRYVYRKHHDPKLPGSPVRRTDRWMPDIGMGHGGVTLAWRW
jgi:membrane-associated phospholipid phosphatase